MDDLEELGFREAALDDDGDVHDFDEMRALGSRSRPSRRTTSVLAAVGNGSLLREALTHAQAIADLYGDEEAHLADRARDMVSAMTTVRLVIQNHPGRFLAQVIGDLDDPERRAAAITDARAALDEIEARAKPTADPDPEPAAVTPVTAMATGSRTVPDPGGTKAVFKFIFTTLLKDNPSLVVIAGGADGVDQLWAEAAGELEIPFTLLLPNWAYEYHYGQHENLERLRAMKSYIGERFDADRLDCVSIKCGRHQVFSKSEGQCLDKSDTCGSNQVYSSSLAACIPKEQPNAPVKPKPSMSTPMLPTRLALSTKIWSAAEAM